MCQFDIFIILHVAVQCTCAQHTITCRHAFITGVIPISAFRLECISVEFFDAEYIITMLLDVEWLSLVIAVLAIKYESIFTAKFGCFHLLLTILLFFIVALQLCAQGWEWFFFVVIIDQAVESVLLRACHLLLVVLMVGHVYGLWLIIGPNFELWIVVLGAVLEGHIVKRIHLIVLRLLILFVDVFFYYFICVRR